MVDPVGSNFMRQSQHAHMGATPQSRREPEPAPELPYDASPLINLPDRDALALPLIDLRDVITRRTTVRNYSPAPLTQEELSYLLWCTQGVRLRSGNRLLRAVPSAGGRHAFESYLLLNKIDGLDAGLYRFVASQHALSLLQAETDGSLVEAITRTCNDQAQVRNCAAMFLWVAVVERMVWRYGTRGYRYLHLDAGHVCQNLYLAANIIGCGVCAIGAFNDDALNSLLGLDGESMFVIYGATVGKCP